MLRWLLAATVLALATAAPLAGAQAAPLEAYGRLPSIEDVALSPDGTMVALVLTNGEERRVAITRVGERAPFALLEGGDHKLRSILWADNETLLINASATAVPQGALSMRAEWIVTLRYNIRTRRQQPLLRRADNALNVTHRGPYVRTVDGRTQVFIVGYEFVPGGQYAQFSLFRADPQLGTATAAESGGRDTRDWMIDDQGRAIAVLQAPRQSAEWRIEVRSPGGSWRTASVGAPTYVGLPSLRSLGRDGRSVMVSGLEGDGVTYREIDLATGAWSAPIGQGEPWSTLTHPANHRFAGFVRLDGDAWRWTYFDPADQRRSDAILAAFPGQVVIPQSFSHNLRRIVVYADSPTEGPGYALVDFDTGRATWFGQAYAGIGEADIAPQRYVTYQASDGLEISGYLTLPRGRTERALPLIVLPHANVGGRDTRGFHWMAQALASRGYAVLQPNYRGSGGYGGAFVRAGHGEWGRKMQTDLSDGVVHLARQGLIDPSRVCIVGSDYGGYAALAGVTLQRGVYRCAAAFGAISDPTSFIRYRTQLNGPDVRRELHRWMGVTTSDTPELPAISPLAHAQDAGGPILLIHGRDDTIVPFSQSDRMATALRRANRMVELVSLEGEDHWLSRGDTRLQMLTAVVRFLETHNPPDPASAPPGAAPPR